MPTDISPLPDSPMENLPGPVRTEPACCAQARAGVVARIAARLRKHAADCYPIDRFPPLSSDPHEAEGAASRQAYENAALIAEESANHD